MILRLIGIEFLKVSRKWRTYISLAAIVALIGLIQIVMLLQGKEYGGMMMQTLKDNYDIYAELINGNLIAYIVKTLLYVHIPFLLTIVAGDIIAGEATAGTIRMLMTKPASRFSVITAKYITTILYTALVVIILALMSYWLSIEIFGTGALMAIGSSQIVVLPANDIAWRFALSYLFVFLGLCSVSSLAFLFSSLVENAIGPIISTMAVIIVFTALSFLDVPMVNAIKMYFFTTHIAMWHEFFNQPPQWERIWNSVFILGGHCLAFYGITLWLYMRKDITT